MIDAEDANEDNAEKKNMALSKIEPIKTQADSLDMNGSDVGDMSVGKRIELEKSLLISVLVLLLPAVLIITAIPSATSRSSTIFLSLFLSVILAIFLLTPPPLGVFGISTQYLPAMEIYVVKAAPFVPRSSLTTCTNNI